MNVDSIPNTIDQARDSVGVVTKSGLQDQLSYLSAADWRQVAAYYPKKAQNSDGFYVTDDASGKVTIHNDLTEANRVSHTSNADLTIQDGKDMLAVGAVVEAAVIPSGFMAGVIVDAGTGAALEAGVASLLPAAGLGAVAIGGVIGAGIAYDYLIKNNEKKADAERDLKMSPAFTIQSK